MNKHVSASTANSDASERISLPSTVDLWEFLWRRKFLLVLGAMTGLVLGTVYFVRTTRMYKSEAGVLIVSKRPEAAMGEHRYGSYFEDYVATHRALIVSPLIIDRAIKAADLGALKTFADMQVEDADDAEEVKDAQDDLIAAIVGSLDVGRGARNLGDDANSIMTLAFQGPEADECPVVVQAILDSYRTFLDETYRGMTDDTVGLISQARDLLKNDLQGQEDAYLEFRQQSPLVTRGTDEVNPLQDRLAAIETQRSELLIRRTETESQLRTIQMAQADDRDDRQMLALVTNLRNRAAAADGRPNPTATLENQLFTLLDEEKKLLEHYGPNHPHVVTARERIAATRQSLALPISAQLQEPDSSSAAGANGKANMDAVGLYVQHLERRLDEIRISENQLTKLYDDAHAAAKELTGYELKDERFQRDLARTELLYDGVIDRLQEASLIKDYGGFEARIIAAPQPGEKVWPSGRLVLPISLFAGGLLGLMLALVAELSDKSFHSREEIQTQLRLPVLGQIPRFDAPTQRPARAGDVELHPLLCTYLQPRSPQTEAYRALRNSLFFSSDDQSHCVLQVTSPSTGDGKSILAANLAISIAQSGKRVLLIDGHLGRPRQHELFGVSQETGLGSVIALDAELNDAISKTAVNHLWLLPTGPLPADGSEVFTSPRFAELINVVREQYDVVLIDTAPLLMVSDPSVVAPQVDGVLLVLRLTKDSRRQAKRAQEALGTVHAKLLGVVANGVGVGSRGYRYDEYRDYDDYYEQGNGHSPSSSELETAMR